MSDKPTVFVIMPFTNDLEDVYSELIKAPLEGIGFEVLRADTLLNQRNILQDVVRGIADAALIVADVTGLNPNVMYELGLAHALGKRTVMITQRIDELPFDLRPYRANEYSTNFKRAPELAKLMEDVGAAVLAGSADFSNPVQDYAPEALAAASQVSLVPVEVGARKGASREPSSDPDQEADAETGLFEHIVRMQAAVERVSEVGDSLTRLTEDIGQQIESRTAKIERAASSLGDRSAAALMMIARDTAHDLDAFADEMTPLVLALDDALSDMATGANALARARTIDSEEEAESLRDEIADLKELENSMGEASASVGEFASQLIDIPNMERNLTQAARKASGVVSGAAETLALGEAEFSRARGLLEERLREFERRKSSS